MELNPLTLRYRYVLTYFAFFLIRDRVENDMRNYLTTRPIWGETFSFSLRSFISHEGGTLRGFCLPDFLTTLPRSPYPLIRSFSSSHSTFRYFYHSYGELRRDAVRHRCDFTTCI